MVILCLAGKDLIVGIKHIEIKTNNAPKDNNIGTYFNPFASIINPPKKAAMMKATEPHNLVLP